MCEFSTLKFSCLQLAAVVVLHVKEMGQGLCRKKLIVSDVAVVNFQLDYV